MRLLLVFVGLVALAAGKADPDPSLDPNRIHKLRDEDKCYDSNQKPQRCIPPFENAAFNVIIEATNTCGQDGRSTNFCKQTAINTKSCDVCNAGDHPADFLTDQEHTENATWWQSQTMFEGIQYPNQVNLTLNLGKTFDITYVRVLFESPRPESWAIYKRKNENSPWEPYQYYSATCRDTYGQPESRETIWGDDTRVMCTSEYSDIVPLSKGTVAFSTLEGRPKAYKFDNIPELQEWVKATDLRITLDRMNTFGDEVFGDDQVLQSYYYAIADVAVGARCSCNGHAGECINSTSVDGRTRRVCKCEHNTAGPDCGECQAFYNDAPWGRATTEKAYECQPCNCNGFSDRCFFDKELYHQTGHGGHCLDCRDNRDGPNCERCRENYYARPDDGYCIACNCNEVGSRSLQCNADGKCQCKPGVTGDKCDRCAPNFFDFGRDGCTSCGCDPAGSLQNTPSCDSVTGECVCKDNVEGRQCEQCRPSYFNLDEDNEFGCTPCFCYGHAAVCSSASGYSRVNVESTFVRGTERWAAIAGGANTPVVYDALSQAVTVVAPDREPAYFVAPDRFLGDQRASYNHNLSFTLKIDSNGPAPTPRDIILEGNDGQQIIQPIFGQRNRIPSTSPQVFTFTLHEHAQYGWMPRLSSRAFMSILANLTAIKIRGTYTIQGKGTLNDVKLETAHRGAAGEPADWVEHCDCPMGYVGQFCESCEPGYHHDPPNGGPFSLCVECNCNGHAEICESETGQCICQHNTAGSNCELCARGYYGYPLRKTPDDCKPCPCPENGPCILSGNNPEPHCSECPVGRTGHRCEMCADGYFGNPEKGIACKLCECNNNIDTNAVRNCNQETGECLKCVNNTAGFHCEECLSGYYGDALSDQKEDGCKLCQCYPLGTKETDDGGVAPCDQLTGHCQCKSHVIGRNCDKCEDGYYHIRSGEGCLACSCDLEGSYNRTCDAVSGQCHCRPGITGQRCDACLPLQYGFSRDGCKACDCDKIGSAALQCDADGQCPCNPNVEGRTCNRCKENKYNRQYGCIDCPSCYNLVQDAVNEHRKKLSELEKTLRNIQSNPTVINESGFKQKLKDVQQRVSELLELAQSGIGGDKKSLVDQFNELQSTLADANITLGEIDQAIIETKKTTERGKISIDEAKSVLDKIHESITEAEDYLATDGASALTEAKKRAEHVGQQNEQMTKIAQEARSRAELNLKEAKKLQVVAEQARNTSVEAYNLAKKTISKYTNISDEIRFLESKLLGLEEKYGDVEKLTATAVAKSDAVSKEALSLLLLGTSLPQVNVTELQNRVDQINQDAFKISEQAQALLEQNEELSQDIDEKVKKSEELLTKAEEQQTVTDELMSEVDAASIRAKDAVNRGSQTLLEAQETLKKLSGFDAEVKEARIQAEKAIDEVEEISKLIISATDKSRELQQVLEGSEQNAIRARETAQSAQLKANNASALANETRQDANKTKAEVIKLGHEAEKLHRRVNTTGNTIKLYENQILKDADETTAVKQKIGQAKSNVTTAHQLVSKSLQEIENIKQELAVLPDINNADLNRLAERLNKAEADIKGADLDQRIRSLTEAKNLQSQWVKNYLEEFNRLKIEVENINEMKKVLPKGCFKNQRLEVP